VNKPKRFIISGGPGFGKTSIISALEKRGYICFHEISRGIIKEQLEQNGDILPWKNLEAFSKIVIDKRNLQFEEAKQYSISFFDRGIPDAIAYLNKENIVLTEHYLNLLKEKTYHHLAFLTPPWREIFCNDSERIENFEQACEAHYQIEKTYTEIGYTIVEIPKIGVSERADFILNKINLLKYA
jgi:predicted ATPase